jgi:hypothetical protein
MTAKELFTRPIVIFTIIGLVFFGSGFALGRWASPPNTVVTEKVKEVVVEKVVVQTKTDIKIVKVTDQETIKKLHREITELKRSDGTHEKKTVEDLNVNDVIHTKSEEVKVVYVDKVVEKWQDRVIEKVVEKNTLKQPNWSVFAGAGVSVPFFLGQDERGVPGMKGAVVHLGVSRRVVGPFWMGVIGTTEGYVGGQLQVVW